MTVKEMKQILNQCEEDAEVVIESYSERLGLVMEYPFTCKRDFGNLILKPKGDD